MSVRTAAILVDPRTSHGQRPYEALTSGFASDYVMTKFLRA